VPGRRVRARRASPAAGRPDRPDRRGRRGRRGRGDQGARGRRISSLRNVRRKVELQLAAPLDAKPSPTGASGPVDAVLAATVVALIGFGVVMVYSASAVQATVQYHDPQFFLKRQVAYA